jgi:hypothetical protein
MRWLARSKPFLQINPYSFGYPAPVARFWTFQIAQNLGFNGDFRAWEHLLRIGVSLNTAFSTAEI